MPESYDGFQVSLAFSQAGVKVSDNCGGIPVEALKNMVLRFGAVSVHELGIGVFGVGLNRALFKLGGVSHLRTDTGQERSELVLDVDAYLASDDWGLPAEELPSTGIVGTEINITKPPPEIARDFSDAKWRQHMFDEIGQRYSRFLSRGMSISVNTTDAEEYKPDLRENGPFPIEHRFYKTAEGVSVLIRCGEHADHRFSGEKDYDKAANADLTPEFGWTVLCNDRAVLISDTSRKTGWDGKLHSEFYGFVGTVSFIAGDASKLPWNTTKTDVDLNSATYQMALEDMRRFADKWRTFVDQRKKRRGKSDMPLAIPAAPPAKLDQPSAPDTQSASPIAKSVNPSSSRPSPIIKVDHNSLRFLLPPDISERHCPDKLLALVHEAKQMDLGRFPYIGLVLTRMLFEIGLTTYLVRHKQDHALAAFAKEHRAKAQAKPLSAAQLANFSPKVDEMLAFLTATPAIWGGVKGSLFKHNVGKLKAHQATMNSAAHTPFQAIHRTIAFQVRDDALPILRHLIEI